MNYKNNLVNGLYMKNDLELLFLCWKTKNKERNIKDELLERCNDVSKNNF